MSKSTVNPSERLIKNLLIRKKLIMVKTQTSSSVRKNQQKSRQWRLFHVRSGRASEQNTRPNGPVDLLEHGQSLFTALGLYIDHHIADVGSSLQVLPYDVDAILGK